MTMVDAFLISTNVGQSGFSNTIANGTCFTSFVQIKGDVDLQTKLSVNSPSTNTSSIAFRGSSGEDGTQKTGIC